MVEPLLFLKYQVMKTYDYEFPRIKNKCLKSVYSDFTQNKTESK